MTSRRFCNSHSSFILLSIQILDPSKPNVNTSGVTWIKCSSNWPSKCSTLRPAKVWTRSIFGRSYAAEPDDLVEELARDEAIAEADTLMLTVPNQLGVDYNAHVIESILTHVAPALGWR